LGRFDTVDCPPLPQEFCFTVFLSDTYGDSWNGNMLTIENEGTGEVVHQLTQSGTNAATSVDAFVEEAFELCFECGSCFAADVGGGSYETETAWNIKDAQGGTIAEGSGVGGGSNIDSFCTDSCFSTVCEPGKQPNAADNGCDECEPGKHSDSNDVERCKSCTAGSYSTGAATSCMQVRLRATKASAK
jgi:hypothetical protein